MTAGFLASARCPRRVRWIVFLALAASAWGQGARVRPAAESLETDRDRPIARQQWFRRGRTLRGESAAALRLRAYRQKLRLRAARLSKATAASAVSASFAALLNTGGPWTNLGPAPIFPSDLTFFQDYSSVSGRATRVLVDQSDPTGNTVYLAGAYGGLWKSSNAAAFSNGAVVWTPLIDDQPTLAVGAIAIHPTNNQVLLVGTGEPNSSADSYYGLGILRSQDGGATWQLIDSADNGTQPFKGLGFSRIVFSADNPNLVVAASAATNGVDNGALSNQTTRGLYYSNDGGLSFHLAAVRDGSEDITPGSATSVAYSHEQSKFYAVVRFHGVYSSSDGATWTRLPSQPGGSALSTSACPAVTLNACPIYRGELAKVPGRDEMYIWYVDSGDANRGVFQTMDGGNSWSSLTVTSMNSCGDVAGCGTTQGGYNLALAALPTAAGTDLYAGAVNLFKCSLTSSNPTCAVTGAWRNLTHVYGCNPNGITAHVHPDQHDIDFSRSNPNIIYFANDGGVYRSLNASQLVNSSCTSNGQNPFDSLNFTLGSMSEFVSFSQHPTDPGILLGGTQDNGSPAIAPNLNGNNGVTWAEVNTGDGGFNQINPNNPSEWFTANIDVSIQRCTSGINCNPNLFGSPVIRNSTLGGDHGDFYTPYILDLQATTASSSVLLVGTCRVWRVNGSGANATALSNSLGGSPLPCTGNEQNIISALAAGGPSTSNGSQVIYAGTAAGQVFVTTQSDSGPASWVARNFPNSGRFPISSIALGPSDPSGNTAYATVMGFGVGHVFKTANAGVTWVDVSGNLPDAPADSVLVDPGNPNFVYVGTDVGVFVSADGGSIWMEYGPATEPGLLPNVPVTALRAFTSGARRLRASTYGRGVWEVDLPALGPDFSLRVPAPVVSVFPGQTATFNGTATALAGYGSGVNIACDATATLPASCAGSSVTPNSSGAPFSLTASHPTTAIFNFNLDAVGGDPAATTHHVPLTLNVVDFSIHTTGPWAVARGNSVDTIITFTTNPSFLFPVTVTCDPSTLPPNSSCSSASDTVGGASGLPFSFNTQASTPVGSFTIQLVATSSNPVGERRTSVVVNVQDFSLDAAASGPTTIAAGQSVTFGLTLTPQSTGFNGFIQFSCGNLPSLTNCSFFQNPVELRGSFSGGNVLTITTTAPGSAALLPPPGRPQHAPWYALWMPLPAAVLLGFRPHAKNGRRKWFAVLFLLALFALAALLPVGCGGGGGGVAPPPPQPRPGTPPGTYNVVVTASSGNLAHTTTVTFTVQ